MISPKLQLLINKFHLNPLLEDYPNENSDDCIDYLINQISNNFKYIIQRNVFSIYLSIKQLKLNEGGLISEFCEVSSTINCGFFNSSPISAFNQEASIQAALKTFTLKGKKEEALNLVDSIICSSLEYLYSFYKEAWIGKIQFKNKDTKTIIALSKKEIQSKLDLDCMYNKSKVDSIILSHRINGKDIETNILYQSKNNKKKSIFNFISWKK